MPGADDFEFRLRLLERVEQSVDLRAGQAEHRIDTVRQKTIDDCLAARTYRHRLLPTLVLRR